MSFSSDQGYVPASLESLMSVIRTNVNTQFGTTYTEESFIGTNFYKYFYALVQELYASETKTAEIFSKLQDYFEITNETINIPNTTPNGIIRKIGELGYDASVKPMADVDAGKISICVDVDDSDPEYAAAKLAINTVIKECVVAGVVCQGTESSTITLSNGQAFDFKYALPDRVEVLLRLTITLSDNNDLTVDSPEDIKQKLMDNIEERYQLGKNFEPQKYYSTVDAPWASQVLLEWSDDAGMNYYDIPFVAAFDDLFVVLLENIELIEE